MIERIEIHHSPIEESSLQNNSLPSSEETAAVGMLGTATSVEDDQAEFPFSVAQFFQGQDEEKILSLNGASLEDIAHFFRVTPNVLAKSLREFSASNSSGIFVEVVLTKSKTKTKYIISVRLPYHEGEPSIFLKDPLTQQPISLRNFLLQVLPRYNDKNIKKLTKDAGYTQGDFDMFMIFLRRMASYLESLDGAVFLIEDRIQISEEVLKKVAVQERVLLHLTQIYRNVRAQAPGIKEESAREYRRLQQSDYMKTKKNRQQIEEFRKAQQMEQPDILTSSEMEE
jgi:hypothetical protein